MGVRFPGRAELTTMAYVTPEYFVALRIPLLQGRVFTDADGPSSAPVAIVNQAFVKMYFKNQGPLGQPIAAGSLVGMQVVGVVGNVQQRSGWQGYEPLAPVPALYVPAAQTNEKFLQLVHTWFSPNWIVRSSLSGPQTMAAIESATRAADPLLPTAAFRSVQDLKTDSLQFQRLLAALVGTLAVLAIVLTALGIYGLIANLVSERGRELGIRMALGSTVGQAMRTALRPGLVWVATGLAAGSGIALLMERSLKSFIWGVSPGDPITLMGVAIGLLVATVLASLIPASRIVRLNPADTLRE